MKFSTSLLFASILSAGLLVGCDGGSGTAQPAQKTAAEAHKAAPVVIYTNADEEAQQAMKNALDKNGLQGAYLMQSFGTSELSTYYLESMQKSQKLFRDLGIKLDTVGPAVSYYAPILGNCGALFVNTEVLKADNLPKPTAIADLAKPEYAGHISVPDIMGSSTSWLMTQAMISAKGEQEGAAVIRAIEKNAGAHLEKSGSAPLKKIRAGEAAVGFGLRHQAVADKAKGLPIDFVDPVEGNFTLVEAAAIIDKGDKTNPNAEKVVETIVKFGRTELLKYYPVALYKGETVSAENKPANPKTFSEPLTVELLQKHQKLVKGE